MLHERQKEMIKLRQYYEQMLSKSEVLKQQQDDITNIYAESYEGKKTEETDLKFSIKDLRDNREKKDEELVKIKRKL